MYPKLGVYLYQQVDMIGHDFQTQHLCLVFLAHLTNDGCQAFCYCLYQHLAAILGTSPHLILARVVAIAVGLVGHPAHRNSIQQHATECQAIHLIHTPNKERPRGLRAGLISARAR